MATSGLASSEWRRKDGPRIERREPARRQRGRGRLPAAKRGPRRGNNRTQRRDPGRDADLRKRTGAACPSPGPWAWAG
eukprot:11195511-Lingulodinium_polyedra.AAC.1